MEKAENVIGFKFEKVEMSPLEYIQERVDYENSLPGNLNEYDKYDCPKCKNKGYISVVKMVEGNPTETSIRCDCMNIRKSIKSLLNSGLSSEMLKYHFSDFVVEYEWQANIKNSIKEYFANYDGSKWFYLGGRTGAGKTMLMTCLFKSLINKYHLTGIYMLWNAESKQLMAMSKKDPVKYADRLYELNTCDILYIDDFFKLENQYINDGTSLAYEIINNRYASNKITIISSEITKSQLETKDGAIFGRIYEKTEKGKYFIDIIGEDKDYRKKDLKRGE